MSLIALVPLVPRPTFSGPTALVAPGFVLLLASAAMIFSLSRPCPGRSAILTSSFVTVAAGSTMYGARIFMHGESGEVSYFMSRILLLVLAVSVCFLFTAGGFDEGLKRFGLGTVVLSGVVAVIAVTGFYLFESPLPPRTLGITFPWNKTAGVPRSFGEQGILLSVALSYLLVYRDLLSRRFRIALSAGCFVIVAAGESRNMYLGTFAVVVMWTLIVRPKRWRWARPVMIACGGAVFVMQQMIPYLERTAFGRGVIGEGIFQRNVQVRFTLVDQALGLIQGNPLNGLLGWSHLEWLENSKVSEDITVHNFFASSLLFLGVIAGSLTIWGLFIRPLGTIIRSVESESLTTGQSRRRQWALTAGAGVLVSLNFYEGFFSLTLGIYIGALWFLMLKRDMQPMGLALNVPGTAYQVSRPGLRPVSRWQMATVPTGASRARH